jgi:hypothetical protein
MHLKKYFYTLLVAVLWQITAISQQSNHLVVFTNESQPFFVILNGIRQNDQPETNVRITGLNEDFYRLRVIFQNTQIPPVDQSVFFERMGMLTNIEIIHRRNRFRARYAGSMALSGAPAAPNSQTQIAYQQTEGGNTNANPNSTPNNTVSTPNNVQQPHQQQEQNTPTNPGNHGSVSISWSSNTDKNEDNSSNQTSETTITADWEFIMNGTRCPAPNVSAANFQNFIQRMEAENLFNRENMMVNFIQNHCMQAQQIADLIGLGYTTVNALNIAKIGYRHTWDTQNYHLVFNALKDQNQQTQLLEMLQIKPKNNPPNLVPDNTEPIPSQPAFGGYSAEWIFQGNSPIVDYFGFIGCANASRLDLPAVIAAVKKGRFSEDKMNAAENGIQGKCLTVDEILKISEQFSHESDRIAFIQKAAPNVIDIDRLFLLHSALRHSSSRDELHAFLSEKDWQDYGWVYHEKFDPFLSGYDGEIGKDYPLVDVTLLDRNLKSLSFQSDKLIVLQQALMKRSISVAQLKHISGHFRSDSDLIDMWRTIYPAIFDLDRFGSLESLLRFSSSKEEFRTIGKN